MKNDNIEIVNEGDDDSYYWIARLNGRVIAKGFDFNKVQREAFAKAALTPQSPNWENSEIAYLTERN